jgi:hypothetical protein
MRKNTSEKTKRSNKKQNEVITESGENIKNENPVTNDIKIKEEPQTYSLDDDVEDDDLDDEEREERLIEDEDEDRYYNGLTVDFSKSGIENIKRLLLKQGLKEEYLDHLEIGTPVPMYFEDNADRPPEKKVKITIKPDSPYYNQKTKEWELWYCAINFNVIDINSLLVPDNATVNEIKDLICNSSEYAIKDDFYVIAKESDKGVNDLTNDDTLENLMSTDRFSLYPSNESYIYGTKIPNDKNEILYVNRIYDLERLYKQDISLPNEKERNIPLFTAVDKDLPGIPKWMTTQGDTTLRSTLRNFTNGRDDNDAGAATNANYLGAYLMNILFDKEVFKPKMKDGYMPFDSSFLTIYKTLNTEETLSINTDGYTMKYPITISTIEVGCFKELYYPDADDKYFTCYTKNKKTLKYGVFNIAELFYLASSLYAKDSTTMTNEEIVAQNNWYTPNGFHFEYNESLDIYNINCDITNIDEVMKTFFTSLGMLSTHFNVKYRYDDNYDSRTIMFKRDIFGYKCNVILNLLT